MIQNPILPGFNPDPCICRKGGELFYVVYGNLRKYRSETLGQAALLVIQMEDGVRTEYLDERTPVESGFLWLRLYIDNRRCWFEWSRDGMTYQTIGPEFDVSKFYNNIANMASLRGLWSALPALTGYCTSTTQILILWNIVWERIV